MDEFSKIRGGLRQGSSLAVLVLLPGQAAAAGEDARPAPRLPRLFAMLAEVAAPKDSINIVDVKEIEVHTV